MNECPKLAAWKRLHERIATYRDGSKWRAYIDRKRDIEGMAYAIAWRKRNPRFTNRGRSPLKTANKRPQPVTRNPQFATRNSQKK